MSLNIPLGFFYKMVGKKYQQIPVMLKCQNKCSAERMWCQQKQSVTDRWTKRSLCGFLLCWYQKKYSIIRNIKLSGKHYSQRKCIGLDIKKMLDCYRNAYTSALCDLNVVIKYKF